MRPLLRALAGLSSITPIVGAFVTACYCAYVLIAYDVASGGAMLADPIQVFLDLGLAQVVLGASFAIALFQVVVMVCFSVHVALSKRIASALKVLWIVGFYFVGVVALPVYWAIYMLRDVPDAPAV